MNEEGEKQPIVVNGMLFLLLFIWVVEVQIDSKSSESLEQLQSSLRYFLETNCINFCNGNVDFSGNVYLMQHVEAILICDIPSSILSVPFWQADLHIHLYTLSAEGSAAETLEGASDVTAYHEWMLPCTEFHNLWEQYILNMIHYS